MPNPAMARMTRRAILGSALFAGASLALKGCANESTTAVDGTSSEGAAGSMAGQTLISTTLPGSWEQFNRNILVPKFAAETGAQALLVTAVSADQMAQLQASPNRPPFDVVSMDSGVFAGVDQESLFQKLPIDLLENYGNLADQFQSEESWGPIIGVQAVGIAYNPSVVTTPPTSWMDLWDDQYKGLVALMAMRNNHTIGFMQKIAKIHGGSVENMEPAFAALDELNPNLAAVVANSGALTTLFEQGEVVIAPHDFNSVRLLQEKGVNIDWVVPEEGGFALTPMMSIVKNPSASVELAAAYIDTALSEEVQARMVETNFVLPVNRNTPIPEPVAQKLGNTLDEILVNFEFLDWATINQYRAAWMEEFDRIVQI